MAKIISISMSEDLLKEIDDAKKSFGFSGRSEVIRSSMKLLLGDLKEKEKLKGHVESVLVLIHDEAFEKSFIRAKHRYEEIITTQVHNKLCNDKCLVVFVLDGSAEKIGAFFSEMRTNKRAEYVKLIVP